ncbi:MAG: hypothetical protein H7Z13_04420 [Ferruginibacter sp.]|nr:hypothetical protein [Ferruginibacter sp.]
MKQHSIKSLVICLRICITALILCILSLFLFSFVATTKLGDDIWQQLGLNKQQGAEEIYRSFTGGYLNYYQARNAKNIASGNRVAVAKDLLAYAKQYVNSDAFKKEYEAERKSAKPAEAELKPIRTRAEIQKDEIAKMEKSVKELEKNMKGMDAAMQKSMVTVLDMYKKMLKEYQDPNHEYFRGMMLMEKSDNEQRIRSYEERLRNWEKNYPANYSPVIKERLQKFLEVTKDVDFSAELKTSYNKRVFVNPAYERKSTEWKQAFRAGKEVTTMAREFATQWLSEIK